MKLRMKLRMKLSRLGFLKKIFSHHHHKWELVSKVISEPKNIQTNKLYNTNFSKKLVFGATTFIWECKDCGKLRIQEILGMEVVSLDRVLDRVDEYGNQPIVRENKEYIILPKKDFQKVLQSQPQVRQPLQSRSINEIPLRRV